MPLEVLVNAEAVAGTPAVALKRLLVRAVRAAATEHRVQEGELSVTLLHDVAIAELNRRFLGHAGPTDVLAFALFDAGEPPVGDIYLGYDQAVRQASENGISVEQELARLAVHGTLHVLGQDHPAGEDRTASPMWALQERIVSTLFEHE